MQNLDLDLKSYLLAPCSFLCPHFFICHSKIIGKFLLFLDGAKRSPLVPFLLGKVTYSIKLTQLEEAGGRVRFAAPTDSLQERHKHPGLSGLWLVRQEELSWPRHPAGPLQTWEPTGWDPDAHCAGVEWNVSKGTGSLFRLLNIYSIQPNFNQRSQSDWILNLLSLAWKQQAVARGGESYLKWDEGD